MKAGIQQALWRLLYEYLSASFRQPEWKFMNYGFKVLDPNAEPLKLETEDEPDRLCIQLYHHVASAIDLTGLDVLEVGSGRGGGASYVARYLHPRSYQGMDLSTKAVELSNRDRKTEGLSFVQGNAEALPFERDSFDAVLNVESSHCYPSFDKFVSEVARVLRPGGYLLFADLRGGKEGLEGLQAHLHSSGLKVVKEELITPNVLASLVEDSDRKLELIKSKGPKWMGRQFLAFAGIKGSRVFEDFASGEYQYVHSVLQKQA
jgi:ubiquinone/menaquinone biosynthesis C-methylase UbiE